MNSGWPLKRDRTEYPSNMQVKTVKSIVLSGLWFKRASWMRLTSSRSTSVNVLKQPKLTCGLKLYSF